MDLNTDYRRRMLALNKTNPSLRVAAAPQPVQTPTLKPLTSANLPIPIVRQPAFVQQPTQQQVQTPTQPKGQFTFKQRADKGFDFFDPSGAKTTIEKYTQGTGTNGSALRKQLAAAGDPQSTKIVNAPQTKSTPKKPSFIEFLPQAASQFAQGVGGIFKSIFYDAPKTFVDQLGVAEKGKQTTASGGAGLNSPEAVQNQVDYINSEVGKALTRKEADAMIADLKGKSETAQDVLAKAENEMGIKYDPSAGAFATIDAISLVTGIPGIISAIRTAGKKVTADEVANTFEKQLGKPLSPEQKAVVESEINNPATTAPSAVKNEVLPDDDVRAIVEAGGTPPRPTAPIESALPESDLIAIREAGGTVPQVDAQAVLPKTMSDLSRMAKNSFENAPEGAKPGGIERAWGEIDNATAQPVRVRRTEEGDVVIEDGRHRVEAARKNGVEDFPIQDVSEEYAKKIDDIATAQTGTADNAAPAVKTTSPDLAQADISANADNVTDSAQTAVKQADTPLESNLLPSVTKSTIDAGKKGGEDFVMADAAHPRIKSITTRLNEIDSKLSNVAEGKTTLSRTEIRALKDERDRLIQDAQKPFEGDGITTPKSEMRVEDIAPGVDDPDTKAAIQRIIDELSPAQRAYNSKTKNLSQEKAARINSGNAAYETAGGGEAGVRAKLSKLRGQYSKSKYEPIAVDEKTSNHLLDKVEKSGLRDFEKLNTQNALRKIWGANPEAPTQADINYIRKFFNEEADGLGDEVAEGVSEALKGKDSIQDVVAKIAGLPRALMATGDFSGAFRQAGPLGSRHPKLWGEAIKESTKWTFSNKGFEKAMKEIVDSDNYALISDKLGVDLPGAGALADEGMFAAEYAEKIPGYGRAVKAFDRNYTGVLTKLRYDVANEMIKKAGGADNYVKQMRELYGDKADEAMRAYGEVINTFSGRGGKRGGILDQHMKTLSTTLFAPRLWAANLQRLNPAWYASLYKKNPAAAKLALQSQATFLTMAGSILGLATVAGATVGMDPRSADFGKIKVGNTRYDILGGQQQNAVLLARLITGQKVNSETGEVANTGEDFGSKTRMDLVTDMFENKANPLLGFGIRLMNAHADPNDPNKLVDEYGEEFNIPLELTKLTIPLGVQGAVDTSIDVGDPVKGIAMNVPSFVGAGVQTYGSIPTKDKAVDDSGKVTFKGKVEPDMVTDKDGKAVTDAKGNVVRIKFAKDASETEIKALKDEKLRTTLKDNFVKQQSSEDQALMKLSDDELKSYVKDKTISQAKSDKIASLKAQAEASIGTEDPDVTTDFAKDFYKTWNTKSEKEQKDWLDAEPDGNAQLVARQLNEDRASGLAEFKPSNRLSKLYYEYEKDINSHPEYTDIDRQNKAKAFQVGAAKLAYSTDQQDIYSEGGSDDLELLIDNGEISKEDLDKAIELDNQLYASGLTGSLKFSKKFRSTFGYASPGGGRGSGGGGGSDGSSSIDIASYLPSKTTSSAAKPEFSRSPRKQKIAFKTNTPKKSNSKKISITL